MKVCVCVCDRKFANDSANINKFQKKMERKKENLNNQNVFPPVLVAGRELGCSLFLLSLLWKRDLPVYWLREGPSTSYTGL